MDVSSYQPTDLSALIAQYKPEHVVVKLYLNTETPSQDISLRQIASAKANGCSVGGYVWCYRDVSPEDTVDEAVGLFRKSGLRLPVLWLDVEPYLTDDNIPYAAWVARACARAAYTGVRPGIYTGAWCWYRVGAGKGFADIPLWAAQYKGGPTLDDVEPFGGWTRESGMIWGKQYQGQPIDLSAFRKAVVE